MIDLYANAAGGSFVKFQQGVPVVMEVTGETRLRGATYQGAPKFIQGKQAVEAVTLVSVNGEEQQFSDNANRNMRAAMATALRSAGVPDLQIGGQLTITLTGKVQTKRGAMANAYTAEYKPAEDEDAPLAAANATMPTDLAVESAPQQGYSQAPQGFQQQAGGFGNQGFGQQAPQQQASFAPQQAQGSNPWV